MKKLLFVVCIIYGFISCSTDESTTTGGIYGIVTVKETAEPMRATGVELYSGGSLLLKTVTYDDGHYEFESLSAGEYELKVVATGYVDASYKVVVESGRTARADMQLERLNTHMTVSTLAATDIRGNKVTLHGSCKYEFYNNYQPNEYGFVYSLLSTPSNGGTTIISTSGFSCVASNLTKGKYYYQAYAKNRIGTEYGEILTFEIDGLPVVNTLAATNVTETTATLNGNIEYEGDPAYTERGFVYSSSFPNPTIDDPNTATIKVVVQGTSKEFSANIANLTDNTTYYVRAYVVSSTGVIYGNVIEFAHSDYIILQSYGIMVQKYDVSTGATWDDANNLCSSSNLGGFSDWRLPTVGECNILYDNNKTSLSFNFVEDDYYWTADKAPYSHYYYKFSSGSKNYHSTSTGDTYKHRVRCVRTIKE